MVALDIGRASRPRRGPAAAARPSSARWRRPALRPNTFDVVLSSEAIEHTPDPRAAGARACTAWCEPGGASSLSMPNRLWQAPVRAASLVGLRPYDGYENFLWPQQLRAVLERAGAEIVEHRGIHLWPFQITPLRGLSRWVDRFGDACCR